MGLSIEDINGFIQKASKGLISRVDSAIENASGYYKKFQKDFGEGRQSAITNEIVVNAMSDNCVIAPYVRAGTVSIPQCAGEKGLECLLLLPMRGINAYFFDFGKQSGTVPALLQNIMFRMLASMRPDLLKISIVDMDYGNDFPLQKAINNEYIKKTVVYSTVNAEELVRSLVEEVNVVGKKLSVKYDNIDDYNAENVIDPIPYHLVIIDDFSMSYTPQAINNLTRLIRNGNARKAGILVFLNYCGDETTNLYAHGFNVDVFRKDCGTIVMNNSGDIRLSGMDGVDIDGLKFKSDNIGGDVLEPFLMMLNQFTPPKQIYSLDGWTQSLISEGRVWQGCTIEDGVKVPAGFVNPKEHFWFSIANPNDLTCNDYFSLVAGDPGMGKSTLVKNIIINAALKYAPDELNFYLVDFSNGVEYKTFRELPHVRALMLANSKEFAVRILDDIKKEVEKRSRLFEEAQQKAGVEVDDFATYRRVTGKKIPYILLIMDEFHVLFNSTDDFTKQAKNRLCNGIRQWRKFGIGAMLCTQSISGVDFGEADDFITYRFALKLSANNSRLVLRNTSAVKLVKRGEVIMNNSASGDENRNVLFQGAGKENYLKYVRYLSELYGKATTPYICEAGSGTDMASNNSLREMLTGERIANVNECDVFVGRPDLLRVNHTRLRLNRQPNSNVLLLGDDFKSLDRIMSAIIMQIEKQSPLGSKVYIVNAFESNSEQYAVFDDLSEGNGFIDAVHSPQVEQSVEKVWDELKKRKQLQQESKFMEQRVVLIIMNTQNCYPLRRIDSGFREVSALAAKLVEIIRDGSELGIHVVIHSLSLGDVFGREGFFESDLKDRFANVIVMTNSGLGIGDILCGVRLRPSVDQKGRVLVMNNGIDKEPYEQCGVYDRCTITPMSDLGSQLVARFFVGKNNLYSN